MSTMEERLTHYDFRLDSADRRTNVTFNLEQFFRGHFPSLSCTVKISDHHFQGLVTDVWFGIEELKSFAARLRELEQTREGFAELISMSPDEFVFRIQCHEKAHFSVHYRMKKIKSGMRPNLFSELNGSFDLEPEFMTRAIAGFKKLINIEKANKAVDFRAR